MFLLATNKKWQEKARKEVVESFGHNVPNADGLSRLKTVSNQSFIISFNTSIQKIRNSFQHSLINADEHDSR